MWVIHLQPTQYLAVFTLLYLFMLAWNAQMLRVVIGFQAAKAFHSATGGRGGRQPDRITEVLLHAYNVIQLIAPALVALTLCYALYRASTQTGKTISFVTDSILLFYSISVIVSIRRIWSLLDLQCQRLEGGAVGGYDVRVCPDNSLVPRYFARGNVFYFSKSLVDHLGREELESLIAYLSPASGSRRFSPALFLAVSLTSLLMFAAYVSAVSYLGNIFGDFEMALLVAALSYPLYGLVSLFIITGAWALMIERDVALLARRGVNVEAVMRALVKAYLVRGLELSVLLRLVRESFSMPKRVLEIVGNPFRVLDLVEPPLEFRLAVLYRAIMGKDSRASGS